LLCQYPFGGPEHVLHYLARYTHRVAISNHRILAVNDSHVTFRWKDYAHHNKQRTMTLTCEEFLRSTTPLAQGIPAHSLLRLARQSKTQQTASTLSRSSPELAKTSTGNCLSNGRLALSPLSRTDVRAGTPNCHAAPGDRKETGMHH
jgi:hypothetical protein